MMAFFKLNKDHSFSPCSIEEWGDAFESENRTVAKTFINAVYDDEEDLSVSTVFLGLDHNYSEEGAPILFETMVFGLPNEYQRRYTTWDEAVHGHEEVCQLYRRKKR
jgi:hypothetical protein